jgi:signal peptidase I
VGGPLAIATFVASLCVYPAIVWLTVQANAPSLWTTLAVLVIAGILWLTEQIAVKNVALRQPNPQVLVGGFFAFSCITLLAAILVLGFIVTGFGAMRMAGTGMSPTIEKNELMVYHKHVDWRRVEPGAIIVYKNADDSRWGRPGLIVVSRILAGPGDQLCIKNASYLVNGKMGPKVTDPAHYATVIDVPSAPEALTVPDACYFVVQEFQGGGFDSRVLSWVRTDSIIGSRLWYLSGRGLFKPVE